MRYLKPALTFDQQLDLLRQRGLTIHDTDRALRWLRSVSYYRLSAYFLPFKDGEQFRPDADFNEIAGLYIFDRKLRLLILDAIERIEVAIRTSVTYEIGHAYGAFGHTDPANFAPGFDHPRFMGELLDEERRAKETFASHYRKQYAEETHLPVWMATELLSLGTISRLYQSLDPKLRQKVATPYKVDAQFLVSWLHTLTYVRNVCAHHKRLWNRQLAIKPRFPSRSLTWPHQVPDNGRLYAVLVVLRHMMMVNSPNSRWADRLHDLLAAHATVPQSAMGFPCGWQKLTTWR
ncbi:MAG TPA: Abi family protein [Rhodanobacteraceae bacterium]|nr:Abi family protein [Rhodanobacteraceae bacterium]